MASNYNSNPFLSDDIDDVTFLKNSRSTTLNNSTLKERQEQLLRERREIEERTVQSSFRSISLLQESEEIGNATAHELVRQREQLENTEKKLDDIKSSLNMSQKHIQGIKSVFGSIKNYFSGGVKGEPSSNMTTSSSKNNLAPKEKSELSQILESHQEGQKTSNEYNFDDHPAMRNRNIANPSTRNVDDVLDKNLDEIGLSLSRLKGIGLGLQDEIESQNELVDRMTYKSEDVDFNLTQQNKDMNRILKK